MSVLVASYGKRGIDGLSDHLDSLGLRGKRQKSKPQTNVLQSLPGIFGPAKRKSYLEEEEEEAEVDCSERIKRQCFKPQIPEEKERRKPILDDFGFESLSSCVTEHVMASCEAQNCYDEHLLISKDELRKWITEGVNHSLNPLIARLSLHLEQQIARLESYYDRNWNSDTSYIS